MKTAAKVFIWIGMILGAIWIVPLVIGILSLVKLSQAKSKAELQILGILSVIFCSVLGGVFMLCIKEEELTPKTDMTAMFGYLPQSPQMQTTIQTVQDEQVKKMQAFVPSPQPKATKKETPSVVENDTRSLFTAMCIFTMLILSIILIPLSITMGEIYWDGFDGVEILSIIASVVQTALAGVILAFYVLHGRRFSKLDYALQYVLAGVSVLQTVFFLLLWDSAYCSSRIYYNDTTYTLYTTYNSWSKTYSYYLRENLSGKNAEISFSADPYIINAVIAFVIIALVATVIVLQLTKPKETKKMTQPTHAGASIEPAPTPVSKPVSPMEYELTEVKRLLDASLITEEEHQKMRTSIIAKYF